MQVSKILMTAGLAFSLTLIVQPPAHAASNLLFLLDGSNSMWGKVNDRAKIDVANEVLSKLVGDLPSGTRVGLVAYGHSRKDDCNDIQVLMPFSELDSKAFKEALRSVVPTGKTPLAAALETSIDQFADLEQNNSIVVISDGIDTCGGDPCAAVADLKKKGFNVRVHVVGFDVNTKERQQLECIAREGNGQYFHATSIQGFKQAVARVQQAVIKQEPVVAAAKEVEAAQATPPAKAKTAGAYFQDEFEGESLSEQWDVLRPNTDSYAVEGGQLIIVSSKNGNDREENVENMFQLKTPLPEGNWNITVRVRIDFQTQREAFVVGLFDGKDKNVAGRIHAGMYTYNNLPNDRQCLDKVGLYFQRRNEDESKSFTKLFWQNEKKVYKTYECSNDKPTIKGAISQEFAKSMEDLEQPLLLRLQKQGRSYTFAAKSGDSARGNWIEVDKFTIFGNPGTPAFYFTQMDEVAGESTAQVDWFRIEAIK
jgi:hypothetical protein